MDNEEKLLLVSLGGGRVGGELIDCALEASNLLTARLPHHLLIFAGPYFPEEDYQRLTERVSGNSRVDLRRYARSQPITMEYQSSFLHLQFPR